MEKMIFNTKENDPPSAIQMRELTEQCTVSFILQRKICIIIVLSQLVDLS